MIPGKELACRAGWAAIERSTGKFVGWFGLQPLDDGSVRDVELGYRLAASVWGQGYATEVEYELRQADWRR